MFSRNDQNCLDEAIGESDGGAANRGFQLGPVTRFGSLALRVLPRYPHAVSTHGASEDHDAALALLKKAYDGGNFVSECLTAAVKNKNTGSGVQKDKYDSVRVVVMYDDAEEQRELLGCACVADVSRKDKTAGQQLLVLFSATKKVTGADGKARLSAGLGQLLLLGLARLVEQRTSRKWLFAIKAAGEKYLYDSSPVKDLFKELRQPTQEVYPWYDNAKDYMLGPGGVLRWAVVEGATKRLQEYMQRHNQQSSISPPDSAQGGHSQSTHGGASGLQARTAATHSQRLQGPHAQTAGGKGDGKGGGTPEAPRAGHGRGGGAAAGGGGGSQGGGQGRGGPQRGAKRARSGTGGGSGREEEGSNDGLGGGKEEDSDVVLIEDDEEDDVEAEEEEEESSEQRPPKRRRHGGGSLAGHASGGGRNGGGGAGVEGQGRGVRRAGSEDWDFHETDKEEGAPGAAEAAERDAGQAGPSGAAHVGGGPGGMKGHAAAGGAERAQQEREKAKQQQRPRKQQQKRPLEQQQAVGGSVGRRAARWANKHTHTIRLRKGAAAAGGGPCLGPGSGIGPHAWMLQNQALMQGGEGGQQAAAVENGNAAGACARPTAPVGAALPFLQPALGGPKVNGAVEPPSGTASPAPPVEPAPPPPGPPQVRGAEQVKCEQPQGQQQQQQAPRPIPVEPNAVKVQAGEGPGAVEPRPVYYAVVKTEANAPGPWQRHKRNQNHRQLGAMAARGMYPVPLQLGQQVRGMVQQQRQRQHQQEAGGGSGQRQQGRQQADGEGQVHPGTGCGAGPSSQAIRAPAGTGQGPRGCGVGAQQPGQGQQGPAEVVRAGGGGTGRGSSAAPAAAAAAASAGPKLYVGAAVAAGVAAGRGPPAMQRCAHQLLEALMQLPHMDEQQVQQLEPKLAELQLPLRPQRMAPPQEVPRRALVPSGRMQPALVLLGEAAGAMARAHQHAGHAQGAAGMGVRELKAEAEAKVGAEQGTGPSTGPAAVGAGPGTNARAKMEQG